MDAGLTWVRCVLDVPVLQGRLRKRRGLCLRGAPHLRRIPVRRWVLPGVSEAGGGAMMKLGTGKLLRRGSSGRWRHHGNPVGYWLGRIALLGQQLVLRLGVVRRDILLSAKDAGSGYVWSMGLGGGRRVLAGLALGRGRFVRPLPQVFHVMRSTLPLLSEALVEFRS